MCDISLIIPTYGRYTQVEALLQSISEQTYPLDRIEVILIDQNDSINLCPIVEKFADRLQIIHEKTSIRGIANAKNAGIKLSKAPIVTFPDDDCTYYPDTITAAIRFFQNRSDIDIAYGRVYDRHNQSNIMRNWPDRLIELNLYNFHLNYSAITCFTKRKELLFDARFGVGAHYSSGEELDYVICALKKKYKIFYTNTIDIWHPRLDLSVMPLEKVYNYAKGYGAICKKHTSLAIYYLFSKSLAFQVVLAIKSALFFQRKNFVKHYTAIEGRLSGFIEFKDRKQ